MCRRFSSSRSAAISRRRNGGRALRSRAAAGALGQVVHRDESQLLSLALRSPRLTFRLHHCARRKTACDKVRGSCARCYA